MKLEKLDLTKGDESEHPDLNTKDWFLVKIDKEYFAGKFSKQWYGYNFDGWLHNPNAGLQYDKPGTNMSSWKAIWRIITPKRKKK